MTTTDKLMIIQAGLVAPKNQRNSFGWYNYRSCEDILEAVKPLLYTTKTTLTISDEMVAVGDRIYVKATATLKDAETWEIIESNTAYARESESKKWMDDSQITGATSSYARKYALNGLFCIDDMKDADATNTHWKAVEKKPASKTVEDNPQWWFQRAINNEKFMLECMDEEDFINKIKSKYAMDDLIERQLRDKFKEVRWQIKDDPANLPFD